MEDRKRFLALPYVTETESDTALATINPVSTVLKPKPILVDKQSSEPSSPITRSFKEQPVVAVTRKPMHRGYSDLGNRIKKKVTLRLVRILIIYRSTNYLLD